jgi:hypothetical protein
MQYGCRPHEHRGAGVVGHSFQKRVSTRYPQQGGSRPYGEGLDGNGLDGNGLDGNGLDGNGLDGNGLDGNGLDGNGNERSLVARV